MENKISTIRNWTTLAQFFMGWVSGVNVLVPNNEPLKENAIEELGDNHVEMLYKFAEQFNALPTPESLNYLREDLNKMSRYVGSAVKENNPEKAVALVCAIEESSPSIMQELIDLAKEININSDLTYATEHIKLDGGDDGHAEMFKSMTSDEYLEEARKIWGTMVTKTGLKYKV